MRLIIYSVVIVRCLNSEKSFLRCIQTFNTIHLMHIRAPVNYMCRPINVVCDLFLRRTLTTAEYDNVTVKTVFIFLFSH